MANAEIECIVRDTRELMCQIGAGERRVEEMIRRVNTVNEKMACMREYQNIMNAVNAYTINGSRRAVLLEELQRENRQILAYHEENRNLREAIDESMETLGIVMARHRAVMARMGRLSKQPSFQEITSLLPKNMDEVIKEKDRFRQILAETSQCMKGCEDQTAKDIQQLSQLTQENQVLKEMLNAAAISTPGVKQVFAKAVAEARARRAQMQMNGRASDDDSDTEDELNTTAIENNERT